MIDNFITWEMLSMFASFVTIVYFVVEFIKEMPFVVNVKTKYVSAAVSFGLLLLLNARLAILGEIDLESFLFGIPLWMLSAMLISFSANGISDFNNQVLKNKKDIK